MRRIIELTERPLPGDEFHLQDHPAYLELFGGIQSGEESVRFNLYLLPADEHTYLVVGALDHDLDPLMEALLDRGLAPTRAAIFSKRMPTFGRLLTNMATERYSDGAFLYLRDPDNADMKWCVATVVGNVATPRGSALAKDDRIARGAVVVIERSIELIKELLEARLTTADKARLWARSAQVTVEDSLDGMDLLGAAQWVGKFLGVS